VPQTPEVEGITRATSLLQWRAPHLTKDGVRAEEALLDAAVRGRRRALAEHLMLRLLLLVLWQVRLSVLPHVARVVGGRDAAESLPIFLVGDLLEGSPHHGEHSFSLLLHPGAANASGV
jgi:hypothetical protein